MAENHCRQCESCIHSGLCSKEINRKIYTGKLKLTPCKQYKSTANVVEVVRCKECGYCELSYPAKAIGEEAIEGYFCWLNQKYLKPTDFCSYGELKELGK